MKRKLLFALALLLSFSAITYAQTFTCESGTEIPEPGGPRGQTCSFSSSDYTNFYRLQSSWYPTANVPIKSINIAFIIRQKSDGTGNYSQSNPADIQTLNDIVTRINYFLSNNENPSDPRTAVCGSSCYVQDSRIRVNRVQQIFTQNTSTFGTVWSTADAISPSEVINVFFVGDYQSSGGGCIPGGRTSGANIWMANQHCSASSIDAMAQNILHEIFHSFGVHHVYANGTCGSGGWFGQDIPTVTDIDYLTDVFGNTGTHTWETYLYNGCIGGLNNCNPFSNTNDNCTNNFMGSRGKFISKMQMGRLHRNMMLSAGMRRYVCGYDASNPYLVQSNQTWDFNVKFYQDIIVKAGYTLTLTCQLNMVPGAKIIVEQNGKLIIDGGVITTGTSYGCTGLWAGIQVWGNSLQHQQAYATNTYYQGKVEMKNAAIIENASTAISLGKAGDWQMYYTGGIVNASGNSIFHNNKRDVEFLKYQNFNPVNQPQKWPNVSSFRNCSFLTTAALIDGTTPNNHVTMWNVDGVRFYGCLFENSYAGAGSLAALGNGIYTEDAHFIATGCDWVVACMPGVCCNAASNTFKNLNYGIWAKSSGSTYNYTVDKNNFINCAVGVQNDAVNNAIITRNTLTVGKPRYPAFITSGVSFNTGTGYRVEENVMTKDVAPNSAAILGAMMTNTGMNNNQVYKNTYTNLYLPNYSYIRNRGLDANGIYSGLAFLCNTYSGSTQWDEYAYGTDPVLDGMRQYQGKLNTTSTNAIGSAGNSFTRSGVNTESDIYNPNTPNFTYFYEGSPLLTNPKYPFYVSTTRVTRALSDPNSCPSAFSSGGGGGGGGGKNDEHVYLNTGNLNESSRESLAAKYTTLNQLLHDSKAAYDAILDANGSNALQSQIQSSTPSDVWDVRQRLLDVSPYLTKTSLLTTVETAILPDAILAEILQANPELLKDETVRTKLAETQFPTWMLQVLQESNADITSSRTLLEGGISQISAERDQMITYILQDLIQKRNAGEESNRDEARTWYANYKSAHGDYQLADDFFETKEYQNALSVLNAIPTLYKLNAKELHEHEGVKSLVTLLASVEQDGRTILQLSEGETAQVQDIADNGEGLAQVRACNLISFVNGTECHFEIEVPGNEPVGKKEKSPEPVLAHEALVSVDLFPNPAKEYLEVRYTMAISANRIIELLNPDGTVVATAAIQGAKGQTALDIRNLPSGNYFCRVSEHGKAVSSQKFVIVK